jgi:hypothetical protein
MRLVGNVLPLVNVVLYFLVDRTGGAYRHAFEIVAGVAAVELIGIAWFCRRRTARPTLLWAPLGLAIDLATSVVIIGVVLFVFVAIAYAIHGGGD